MEAKRKLSRSWSLFLSLSLLFLSVTMVGSTAVGDAASGAPARRKAPCAEYQSTVARPGKEKLYTVGSWGSLPRELRKLPPGSELCGADFTMTKNGVTVIRSPLFGKDIETFYGPLFGAVGCKSLECDVRKSKLGKVEVQQTSCTCRGDHMLGSVATDSGSEMFVLSLTKW